MQQLMRNGSFTVDGIRPNPTSGEVVLSYSFEGSTPVSGEIYIEDALGREVVCETITLQPGATRSSIVSLKGLPSGIYLVRVSDGVEARTLKVAKEQ